MPAHVDTVENLARIQRSSQSTQMSTQVNKEKVDDYLIRLRIEEKDLYPYVLHFDPTVGDLRVWPW